MTNNDILRRLRYTFDFNDAKMIDIFKQADHGVTREQISNWLKKDDDEAYVSCGDTSFSIFLNGLIIDRRGKQDRPTPEPDKKITNNIVLRKLKLAFDMKNEDVLALLSNNGVSISKHELSAFFRRTDHKHYRPCKDQVLRNFLQGLQNKYRPSSAKN